MFLVLLGVAPLAGAASFHVPRAYLAGNNGGTAAVGDFSGDGKPDVAANSNSEVCTVSILLGNGDGALQGPKVSYTLSTDYGCF